MKKNIFLILFVCAFFTISTNAQEQNADAVVQSELTKEVFTVYGNCGMCERTIEGSLKDVEGVEVGDWNKETDEMTVSYDPAIITLDAIKQKIADAGYDSDSHRATEEVYNNLPGCCQYERPSN